MTADQILQELNRIFIDVLDVEELQLQRETVADDVEDWDSLNHIQLIVAIEKHFGVRFTTQEIQDFKNVGEVCDLLARKLAVS